MSYLQWIARLSLNHVRLLNHARELLDSIKQQVKLGAELGKLRNGLYQKLLVISELYRQQKQMYDEKTHTKIE